MYFCGTLNLNKHTSGFGSEGMPRMHYEHAFLISAICEHADCLYVQCGLLVPDSSLRLLFVCLKLELICLPLIFPILTQLLYVESAQQGGMSRSVQDVLGFPSDPILDNLVLRRGPGLFMYFFVGCGLRICMSLFSIDMHYSGLDFFETWLKVMRPALACVRKPARWLHKDQYHKHCTNHFESQNLLHIL